MSSISEKSAFEAFARMEERIEQNERQIKASAEIDEEFSGDRLQKDFKQLEKVAGAASADMQLLALKQKMGLLPSAAPAQNKQIGSGTKREAETVEADIEDAPEEKSRG
jgi:phage shock protein A